MGGFAKGVVGIVAANLVSLAQAELVSHGLTTLDTVSSLEWLDLTQTTGKSFNQVTGEFGTGGLYEGYRYASAAEAQDIFRQVGLPVTHYVNTPLNQNKPALDLFNSLFGLNFGGLGTPYGFVGQVGDVIPGYAGMHFLFFGYPSSINTDVPLNTLLGASGEQLYSTYEATVGLASNSTLYGTASFIVKQAQVIAPVPESSTYVLMLAGLGVLGFVARRRKSF